MTTTDEEQKINEIVDFLIRNSKGIYSYIDNELLARIIKLHIDYGTILTVRDDNTIVAVARWNWETPDTVIIADAVVRDGYKKAHFLRELVALGISHNPQCKRIKYYRHYKYPGRISMHSVDKLLKRSN